MSITFLSSLCSNFSVSLTGEIKLLVAELVDLSAILVFSSYSFLRTAALVYGGG
jgi:hypothetical protein